MPTLYYGAIDLLADPFMATVGTSTGAWTSIQTETTSPFIDGAAVSGDATANREITLSVYLEGATRADMVAASEALIGEANKQANTLTWTPDDGAPVVYDTFRVRSPNRSDAETGNRLWRTYELTIPALPFARSATLAMPSLAFPPGTGGAVDIIKWGTTTVTGKTMGDYSGHGLATEAARQFLQGIPIQGAGGFPETFVVDNAPGLVLGGMTAVSNCSVTSTANQRNVVSTAAGAMVAKSTTPLATSADSIMCGVTFDAANTAALVTQVGIEWFTSGTSIFTDWGSPNHLADKRPVWAASPRPTAATHWGFRLRVTATAASQSMRVSWVLGQAETFGSLTSAANLSPNFKSQFTPTPAAAWAYMKMSATVNVSTQTHFQAIIKRATSGMSLVGGSTTFKLHSSGGKWSAWYYRPDAIEDAAFATGVDRTQFFLMSTPDATSDAGAATLTAVEAVSVEALALAGSQSSTPFSLSAAKAGLGNGVIPPSTRGVVFDVDAIMGSAAAPASANLFNTSTALTDLIAQVVDGADGNPLLQVTTSAAAAAAPAAYQGVYSILVARPDVTVPTLPQLVITQKQGATTVATVTLKGKQRSGNHYVDFGTVSLPLVAVPDENVGVNYSFALTPASASWTEILLLNVNSSLVMLEDISPARKMVWIDRPEIVVGIGNVWVGTIDRTDASSPLQPVTQSSPFTVKAPNVKLLVYSTAAGPSASLSYYPHYLDGLA